jgi:hypothetical protein
MGEVPEDPENIESHNADEQNDCEYWVATMGLFVEEQGIQASGSEERESVLFKDQTRTPVLCTTHFFEYRYLTAGVRPGAAGSG